MKVTGIISALIFAHVAMGQASDSTSATTSSVSGTKSANSATPSTKTGTKSASASSSSVPDATPTGSAGSTSSIGPLTETVTGDSNPLIPADISDACSTFLNTLNSDTTVSGCLTSLNTALSSFTAGSGSASAVPKALSSLCSSNSCTSSAIRSKLTEFKDACSSDFASNDIVAKQYEVWYSIIPFKSAICAKDNEQYCLLNTGSSSSNTSNTRRSNVGYVSRLAKAIGRRAQTVLTPDLSTFRSQNIMYLGISPDMNAGELCTPCAQQVLSKYVAWESATPHALGVSKSTLLGGQASLWAAMQEKCPATFTTEITNIAGVPDANQLADGAVTVTAGYFTALATAFAAAFALF